MRETINPNPDNRLFKFERGGLSQFYAELRAYAQRFLGIFAKAKFVFRALRIFLFFCEFNPFA